MVVSENGLYPSNVFFFNQGCQPPNSLSTVCSNAKSIFDVLIV